MGRPRLGPFLLCSPSKQDGAPLVELGAPSVLAGQISEMYQQTGWKTYPMTLTADQRYSSYLANCVARLALQLYGRLRSLKDANERPDLAGFLAIASLNGR